MAWPVRLLTLLLALAAASGQEPSFRLPDFSGKLKPRFQGVEAPLDLISRLEELSRKEPENPAVWYALSKAYEALGVTALDYLGRSTPGSEYWLSVLAYAQLRQGKQAEAEKLYIDAIAKAPRMRGLHVGLAEVYKETGKADLAAKEIEAEQALGKPDCAVEKLACALEAGEYRKILEIGLGRRDAESAYYMSQAATRLMHEAAQKLDKLPVSIERHARDADAAMRAGDRQGALRSWEAAVELAPGNQIVRRELAVAHLLAGDGGGALELAGKLVSEFPGEPENQQLYGELLASAGRPAEAIPHLEKAVAARPRELDLRATLGRCYVLTGATEKAIPHLEAALPSDTDGSLHLELSSAYRRTGDTEKADEVFGWYLQRANPK